MESNLTLHLQYRLPFEIASLLTFLQRRAIPGVEEVVNACYRRTVLLPRSKGIIELEPMEQINFVRLRLQLNNLSDLSILVQRCRHLFDLDAVSQAIAGVLVTDPLLAPLVKARPGLRVPGAIDGFELTVRAILWRPSPLGKSHYASYFLLTTTPFSRTVIAARYRHPMPSTS